MGCCLLAALLVSFARRGWHAVTGRAPTTVAMPPAARRPAPGTFLVAPPDPVVVTAPARPVLAAPLAAALTLLLYVAVTGLLGAADVVRTAPSAPVGGTTRDVVLAVALGALLLVAARARPVTSSPARATGRALSAVGATWTAALVLDVHALGHTHAASTAVDVALHVLGVAALYAGLLLWRPLADHRLHARRPEGLAS